MSKRQSACLSGDERAAKRPLISRESEHAEESSIQGSGIALPPTVFKPWTLSEISPQLPPLPEILDRELEKIVFTHPGVSANANYERLEWLGDAYLELLATGFIYETFSNTQSGRCSQIREHLVKNVTLAGYFREYDLPSRARLPPKIAEAKVLGRGRSNDKDLLKTQSDMFEAYVAAIITSDPRNGMSRATEWLKALWGRTIEDDIRKNEKDKAAIAAMSTPTGTPTKEHSGIGAASKSSDTHATVTTVQWKQELAKAIGGKGIVIAYKDLKESKDRMSGLPLFTVGVFLTGWGEKDLFLGSGNGPGRKSAGHKAAEAALQNKKLIREISERKRKFDEAKKQASLAENS
ncbi:ribonuclease III domain-containing protein [Stachybotrys elegans]|uniref:Ribonuclease III domain-containing protein n=1 Tax=Stachybotrys elegans TaxID=80388 RepID=A0A8K0WTH6_9HYPO|nr:ribonuclease III domain-containing protein [Stachybotrys elegans]